jgi:hypothetical protein
VEVRYAFDPPFALPRAGMFAFSITTWDPFCDILFNLMGDDRNPYAAGMAWEHGRTWPAGCALAPARFRGSNFDLIFTIEFCATATRVEPSSWGRLKALYR